jgi:hypothetical protein
MNLHLYSRQSLYLGELEIIFNYVIGFYSFNILKGYIF